MRTAGAFTIVLLMLLPVAAGFAGEKGVCAVCGPREGAGLEPIRARATLGGREYVFCSIRCKVEFLKEPEAFAEEAQIRPAPPLRFRTLEGGEFDLDSMRGRVVLVDFWATWCRPCLAALPRLERLRRELGPRGLVIAGASIDERGETVRRAAAAAQVGYPVGLVGAEEWNRWGVVALPAMFLIDREGRIVRRFGGEADPAILREALEEALGR